MAKLPGEFRDLVDIQVTKLLLDPTYDLSPETRMSIYFALGPSTINSNKDFGQLFEMDSLPILTTADRIRARTAILVAQKVANLWDLACQETNLNYNEMTEYRNSFEEIHQYLNKLNNQKIEDVSVFDVPRTYIPQHILEMAELAMQKKVWNFKTFIKEVNEWWGIYPTAENFLREYLIKWCSQEALYLCVLLHRYMNIVDYDYSIDIAELDHYFTSHIESPAGLGMLAYSVIIENGKITIDIAKRREFWLWWLLWAIPTAYEYETKLGY